MSTYEVGLVIVAVALLGAAVLPRLLEHQPLSFPVIYVTAGFVLFTVAPAPALDPVENAYLTERLAELVVIVSLMGAGLKLDRPFSLRRWKSTWRLLAVALPLTAGLLAVLAWGVLVLSVFVHGVSSGPVMDAFDRWKAHQRGERTAG